MLHLNNAESKKKMVLQVDSGRLRDSADVVHVDGVYFKPDITCQNVETQRGFDPQIAEAKMSKPQGFRPTPYVFRSLVLAAGKRILFRMSRYPVECLYKLRSVGGSLIICW